MCVATRALLLICLLVPLPIRQARADQVSLWGGGGVGTMLTGAGSTYVNGHKVAALSVALPGDRFRLRLLKGSLERTQGIDSHTRDNDLDYQGFDAVFRSSATDAEPAVAFAIGAARYEEAYHLGYPDQDLGGSEFVHRWGPHVSALGSWPLGRYFEAWTEMDLHFAPYQPRQTVLFLNIGIGVRF